MTKSCTDQESLYSDIGFCQGQAAPAGLLNHFYAISKRDIVGYPTISRADKATLASIPAYTGNFTLAADKKWFKVDLIPDQSQLQVESQGSYGSKSFKNTGTFVIPRTTEEVSGFIAEANNDEMIFLVPGRDGKYRMIGSKDFSPELTLAQDSGKAATDTNSTTVTAVATDMYPAPYYPGTIETADGDISGEDGSAVTTGTGSTGS
ncbi:MAG: hypothetical protein LKF70_11190 [Prevotella sp.]|mgnify:CR=1 FL=1|jgi:hypothetical protein|nr:hypothetical protein [Prevotella sp.]